MTTLRADSRATTGDDMNRYRIEKMSDCELWMILDGGIIVETFSSRDKAFRRCCLLNGIDLY